MVLEWKRTHQPGRIFSEFLRIFMDLCMAKVQVVPNHKNFINGVVNCEIFYLESLQTIRRFVKIVNNINL